MAASSQDNLINVGTIGRIDDDSGCVIVNYENEGYLLDLNDWQQKFPPNRKARRIAAAKARKKKR